MRVAHPERCGVAQFRVRVSFRALAGPCVQCQCARVPSEHVDDLTEYISA